MSQDLTPKFAQLSLQLEEAGAELAGMVPAGAAGGPVLDRLAPQALLPQALLQPPAGGEEDDSEDEVDSEDEYDTAGSDLVNDGNKFLKVAS